MRLDLQWNLDRKGQGTGNICSLYNFRVRVIEVLFHKFYCYGGEEHRSIYRGLCYREVAVPLNGVTKLVNKQVDIMEQFQLSKTFSVCIV